MDGKKQLVAMIERCNENILKNYKKYGEGYLCEEMDTDKIELKDAIKHLSEGIAPTMSGYHKSVNVEVVVKEECKKSPSFALAFFWFNARKSYSLKLLRLEEEVA